MNFVVYQNIAIHQLKIGGISNSSVCQIGSAGMIKPLSNFFNTGTFTKPSPPAGRQPTDLSKLWHVPLLEPTAEGQDGC